MRIIQVIILNLLLAISVVSFAQNNESTELQSKVIANDTTAIILEKRQLPAPMSASEVLRNSIISKNHKSFPKMIKNGKNLGRVEIPQLLLL